MAWRTCRMRLERCPSLPLQSSTPRLCLRIALGALAGCAWSTGVPAGRACRLCLENLPKAIGAKEFLRFAIGALEHWDTLACFWDTGFALANTLLESAWNLAGSNRNPTSLQAHPASSPRKPTQTMPVKDCIFDLYGLGCLLAMCKKTKSVISSCKIRLLPKRGGSK